MSDLKKAVRALLIALIGAILCEMLIFNFKAVATLGADWQPLPPPEEINSSTAKILLFSDINAEVGYLHMDIAVTDDGGYPLPVELTLFVSDQGNQAFYRVGTVSYTQEYPKESYFRLNAYGAVKDLKVQFDPGKGGSYTLKAAGINGAVPFFLSYLRIFFLFFLFALLYGLRPASPVYEKEFWDRARGSRVICVLLVLAVNISLLGYLAGLNEPFVDPTWAHHQQYAKLARSLAEGKTYIETPQQTERVLPLLAELEDPYDRSARDALFSENGLSAPWDTAYYDGHLYVYFGVVPVLLAYLPYYLITGEDLSTASLAVATFLLILLGAFCLMRAFIRRYFPDTPFGVYLLLSLLLGNGTCALGYAFVPSFYVIPVTFSTVFVFMALALWISAARRWEEDLPGVIPRILFGSLCAALVAGCRPQFLIFSFLAIPVFWSAVKRDLRSGKTLWKTAVFLIPYVIVAAGIMYYNAIRFGSVFDFGANYNLTTNNMPLRGWKLSRLPDGFFEFLFRLPNVDRQFPFIHAASTGSPYLGTTIRETMYGGVLVTQIFLWILFLARRARRTLREKNLTGLTVLCVLSALLVIAADTEMAGILWRYTGDFLPLLYIAAAGVFLALYRDAGEAGRRRLRGFLLAALWVTLAGCLLFEITESRLLQRAPDNYYMLRDFFT